MRKQDNIIGKIVLLGILIHLGYVFVFFFDRLDGASWIGRITGATFALASVYFVVTFENVTLKIIMIALDICTILYYYLHSRLEIPIEYSSVIVAAYTGFIIFYIGREENRKQKDSSGQETEKQQAETERLRKELHRLRTDNELRKLEDDRRLCLRRINESKNES